MTAGILVVDDEPDVGELYRQRFRRELRRGEVTLYFALSGAEALDRLETADPEVRIVLSDINMPGMSGLELLSRLRKMRPELPVMMVTAYGGPDNRKDALERGAIDLLGKPVDFAALKQRVQDVTGPM